MSTIIPATLPWPCLCLVTDRRLGGDQSLVSKVARAVAGGVNLVQLREKDLPGRPLLELAGELRTVIGNSAMLLINERVDVAAAARADGVQLGEEALPTKETRIILGPEALIGRSVHSEQGAQMAEAEGADFLLVGTIYATSSHPGHEPAGPELIRRIAASCSLPLIGIGGINEANLGLVLEAGAQGVAVISSILGAPDPEEAARDLRQAMLEALPVSSTVEG
ncbi:MAG: thiamine phosphate synthase [Chloroflexi bacterium]|nr:thiamine phosphate synthase [Chloroflexota bacterium]